MTWRRLGWGAVVAVTAAGSWLWPRIDRVPTDFELAVGYLQDRRPDLALLFFRDPAWRGVAAYRAGRHAQALREFAAEETVPALYNQGNSHVRLRDWPNAAAAYERVLRFDPDHADARHNLALVRQLLRAQDRAPAPEPAPEPAPNDSGEHRVTEAQEGLSNQAQAADSPQSETAGNTNDTDETADSEAAERPKPTATTGQVGSAAAIGRADDDRGPANHRVVGTVDLKPRSSTHPAEVLLRRIRDDPEKVLRARLQSAYETRIARVGE